MLQRPKVIELAHIIEADCLFCLSSGLCSNELLAITVNYMIFKSNMSNFFLRNFIFLIFFTTSTQPKMSKNERTQNLIFSYTNSKIFPSLKIRTKNIIDKKKLADQPILTLTKENVKQHFFNRQPHPHPQSLSC